MADRVESRIRGLKVITHTKLILKANASIVGEKGSWTRLSYTVDIHQLVREIDATMPVRIETFEVKNPIILVNGVVSTVLEQLEIQAQALCK